MRLRTASLAILLLGCGALRILGAESDAGESAEAGDDAVSSGRWTLFTADEFAHFQKIAAERESQRETYIRNSEDDEIVHLEPYIVEGDSSLMLARIRRALERGVGNRPRLMVGLAAPVQHELRMATRADRSFFQASPGSPSDAPEFNGIDLLELPARLSPRRLRELFRAPDDGGPLE